MCAKREVHRNKTDLLCLLLADLIVISYTLTANPHIQTELSVTVK